MILFFIFFFIIISTFLISSKILKKSQFYLFDIFWRLSIIFGVIFFGKLNLNFSLFQWLFLSIIFLTEIFIAQKFFPKISKINQSITIIFAPLAEEVLFRGLLINLIPGFLLSKIIISSFLFGVYHIKNYYLKNSFSLVYQILYAAFFIGPILAWVKLSTNSLFLCIIFHSINNTIGITFTQKYLPSFLK